MCMQGIPVAKAFQDEERTDASVHLVLSTIMGNNEATVDFLNVASFC